jgi:hypothetical protein
MKSLGLLAMSLLPFYGGYRYLLQTDSVRQEFPEHMLCKGPVWITRATGVVLAAGGLYVVYLAVR